MGKIKELYFRLKEEMSGLLFNDVEIEELDKYIEEILDSTKEYRFYLENKQNLLNDIFTTDEIDESMDDIRTYKVIKELSDEFDMIGGPIEDDFDKIFWPQLGEIFKVKFTGGKSNMAQIKYVKENEDHEGEQYFVYAPDFYEYVGTYFKDITNINETLVPGSSAQKRFIDLRGPSGNAYSILGMAHQLAKQLEKVNSKYNWEAIQQEMTSGDYKNLVETFETYFGDYVTIYNADVLDESLNEDYSGLIQQIDDRIKDFSSKELNDIIKIRGKVLHNKQLNAKDISLLKSNGFYLNESKKKNTKERDEIIKRIQYAKDFTPHKVEYYENMLKNYDDSFKNVNEGSDWIYLKSIDMYIDEYTGNFLDKDKPMEMFVEPGDDEYEELVDKLDSKDKVTHREVMTGTSDDYENGQRYPGDHEVPEDDDEEWIDPAGGTHRGDDDEPWKMYEAEDEEYLMPPLDEGCNCGGKKRPKPTIIRRPTNVVTLPPRKKLHESEDEIFMKPLNEVDYEAMARMNRDTDRSPRFVGGMTKPMGIQKRVIEKPEYDYSERKEGLNRISRKHNILKDMGYDLDSEIEMPELAPTKRELTSVMTRRDPRFSVGKARRLYGKFNKLKNFYWQEEKEMNKLFKRHKRNLD